MDCKAASACYEFVGFFESAMVRPENNGYVIYGSFGNIVYAGSESSTDVSDGSVSVNGGEKPEAVYDEAIIRLYGIDCGLCVTYDRAFQ